MDQAQAQTSALVLQSLRTDPGQVFRDAAAALASAAPAAEAPGAENAQRQTLAVLLDAPVDVLACIQQGAGGVALAVQANVLDEVLERLKPDEAARLVGGHLTPATVGGLLEARGENGSILGATVAPEMFAAAVRTVMLAAAANVGDPADDEDDDGDDLEAVVYEDDEDDDGAGGALFEGRDDDRYRPTRSEIAAYDALLPLFVSQRDRPDLQALLGAPLDAYTLGQYVVAAMACQTPPPDQADWHAAGFEEFEAVAEILDGFGANGWPPVPARLEGDAALPGAAAAPVAEAGDLKADF
jgi:hypothetical protein